MSSYNATPLADDTYYISSQLSLTYLTLTSGEEGAGVTAWAFDGGPHQQWILTISAGQYLIKNALYGMYIGSFSGVSVNNTRLVGNSTAAPWLIINYKNGFIIGVPSIQGQTPQVFNLDVSTNYFYNNNTPVMTYSFGFLAGPDNEVWFFNSTSTKATASPSPGVCGAVVHCSPSVGAIAGSAVAAVTVLLMFVTLAFFLGKRRGIAGTLRTPNHPTNVISRQDTAELPHTLTPFFIWDENVSPAASPHPVDVGRQPTKRRGTTGILPTPNHTANVVPQRDAELPHTMPPFIWDDSVSPAASPHPADVGRQPALVETQPTHHPSFSRNAMTPSLPEYTPNDPIIVLPEPSGMLSTHSAIFRNQRRRVNGLMP